mmetsp:Transcript_28712/g.73643  ORF Transcript_28712/g.73643 Transcript_28712/m.73643 type:complete len:145 (+) Transcript_28712:154-588(+)
MVELYTQKGVSPHDARSILSKMAATPDFFVDVMMLEELQMSPPPAITAFAAGARLGGSALVCGGALPLVAMLAHRASQATDTTPMAGQTYWLVLALAVLALAYIGSLRASITHQARVKLSVQTAALALPCILLVRLAATFLAGL